MSTLVVPRWDARSLFVALVVPRWDVRCLFVDARGLERRRQMGARRRSPGDMGCPMGASSRLVTLAG